VNIYLKYNWGTADLVVVKECHYTGASTNPNKCFIY